MKKIISALLVFVMLVASVFALTSCSKPELNFDKAKANLEAAGYSVTITDDRAELMDDYVGAVKALKAYKSSDEQVIIITFDSSKTAKLYIKEYEMEFDREIEYAEFQIRYYEHMLKTYADELDADDKEDYEEEIDELKKDIEEAKAERVIGRSGKTVWYGTKVACDASKGK